MYININGELLDLSSPVVMGIINMTPDSFFAGSRIGSEKHLLHSVEKMIKEGVAILDFGGYSSRPQAVDISEEEEFERLASGLEPTMKRFPNIPISVDTFRSGVARQVVENFGVGIINDISGGTLDDLMFETVAELRVAYILMHTKGTPQTMQSMTDYDDVVADVMAFLQKRIAQLHQLGVKDIIADPGFGFAKTIDQNYELLHKLSYFQELNVPVLAGISRKSMIYKLLDIQPEDSLNGTTALNMLALQGGASILRVHDVKEAVETIRIYNRYIKSGKLNTFEKI